MQKDQRIILKIVGAYVIISSLWILFSDQALSLLAKDMDRYRQMQPYKDWLFILLTTLLLFGIIRYQTKKLKSSGKQLLSHYEELEATYEAVVAMDEEMKEQYEALEHKLDQLQEAKEKYQLIVEGCTDNIWDQDFRTGRMVFHRTKEMLGYKNNEWEDTEDSFGSLVHPKDLPKIEKAKEAHLSGQEPHYQCEFRIKNSDGDYRWIQSRGKAVLDDQSKPLRMSGSHIDVTEQKHLMMEIQGMAYYDALTELPNRTLFYDHLEKSLNAHRKSQRKLGLLSIDLDDFKRINDTRGHQTGDEILRQGSERLSQLMKDGEILARSGGDEFLILKPGISSRQEMEVFAQKILNQFIPPFRIGSSEFFMGTSIGAAMYPEDGEDRGTLIQYADAAMNEAKAQGKNNYRFFDQAIQERVNTWMETEKNLRHALQRDEFVLYYQPVMQADTQLIFGAEALIRWDHPEKGILSPVFFMDIAEESGQIIPIGEWVMQTALSDYAEWAETFGFSLTISVNLSPVQFKRPDLAEWIDRILQQYGVPPENLQIEITETAAMENLQHSIETLGKVKNLGVKVALDDFGTGYSSLNYLRVLPLDVLKIDKSFIDHLGKDSKEAAIVKQIITLARELELKVIAEGVELKEQKELLQQFGCEAFRGYLFYKPMPEHALRKCLEREHRKTERQRDRKVVPVPLSSCQKSLK